MKYKNLIDKPLFGNYTDPYKDRRVEGPIRPKEIIPYVEPDFKRKYNPNLLYVSWLGHSSIFINMSGMNLLIDPIFSTYASPIPVRLLKRFDTKRISEKDFDDIDIVFITHNHYDHLDRKTLVKLDSKVKQYIVPKDVGYLLKLFGIRETKIIEMDWNQKIRIQDIKITCLPTQHGSSRFGFDSNQSLWCSYLLRNEKYTVYDTGDGGYTPYFKEIYNQYGSIDLAIMECGQYNEKWHGYHMFPEESVQAAKDLHAKLSIPVHHSAFILSDHAWNESFLRYERMAKELEVPYELPILYKIKEL